MTNIYSSGTKAEDLIDFYKYHKEWPTRSIINEEQLEKKHILFLGDSFIYGCGISYNETMSSQFERLLDKTNQYSVFNLGLPGGSLEASLLRLQQWCNSYGNHIHSVYFGMTSKYRYQYWIDDSHQFNYIPGTDNIPIPEKTVGNERFIAKTLNKLVPVTDFQTVVKFDHIMKNLKNLSQLHDFNLFSFYTTQEQIDIKHMNHIKECLESNTIGKEFKIYEDIIDFNPTRLHQYNISADDGHWNGAGNKFVSDNILYPETNHWYI